MSGPPPVVVGLGARRDVPAADLDAAIDRALTTAGIGPAQVTALATLDRRAAEPGIRAVALRRGWTVHGFPPADLREVAVPTPSDRVRTAVGAAGVAEAAALRAAGPAAVLILPKLSTASVSVAIATRGPQPVMTTDPLRGAAVGLVAGLPLVAGPAAVNPPARRSCRSAAAPAVDRPC